VDFELNAGVIVPEHVHVVDVPDTLIEIRPEWRGDRYFVVRDEIVIVDGSRHIVATLPLGGQVGSNQAGPRQGGGVALSVEEIRAVQIALKDKGFSVEIDGVLGPRTKQALIQFQRRQGLQASGEIDVRTKTALGMSNERGGAATTGQGGTDRQSGEQRGSGSDRDRSGSSGNMQPPANQDRGGASRDNGRNGQPGTTGQGSRDRGNAPAQGGSDRGNAPSQGGSDRGNGPSQGNPGQQKNDHNRGR
jgi:peptidoglycan hydrolase-like protein with peptidoglycan-binding domain